MTSGAGGGASWARAVPTQRSSAAASVVQAKHLRFIFVSPLLSREVAKKILGAASKSGWAKPAPTESSRKADGLRLPVLTYEQVDLNPFVGTLLVYRQAEIAESTALHADADDGAIADFLSHAAGEEREILGVIGGHERRFVRGVGRVVVDCGNGWARRRVCGGGGRIRVAFR